MMETSYARREARTQRLNRSLQSSIKRNDFDGVVKNRFALLDYSYAEEDSGGGSALASITAAAATLGAAYVATQAPNNGVLVPTRTNPAYGAGAPRSSGLLIFGVLAVVTVGVILFVGAKG